MPIYTNAGGGGGGTGKDQDLIIRHQAQEGQVLL